MSTVQDEHGLDIIPSTIEEITITVRFSASLPDLELTLPTTTNTASLKQQIRTSLPKALAQNRLRLIHAGKALDDGTVLRSLRRPDLKGKAKAGSVYVHCSIGDIVLSAEDIAAEAQLSTITAAHDESTTTAPAPRGFDRLLGAGFSPAEVLSLRQQFMAIQAHSHTPDSMPDAEMLRDMEESWLDNGSEVTASQDNWTDDLIAGTVMGFFWPVGCLIWGVREEGIFSPQRKIAIVFGLVLNLGLGFVRWGG